MATTINRGAMVRARRFFFCTTNSPVLCLPFSRNPINYVPKVLTNAHGHSVTADQAFARVACQVVPPGATGASALGETSIHCAIELCAWRLRTLLSVVPMHIA